MSQKTMEELLMLRKKCVDRKGYEQRLQEIDKEIKRRENDAN